MNSLSSPNALSAFRIASVPFLVAVFWLPDWAGVHPYAADIAAASLFGAAAISDFVDGWLARRHGWQTRLGAFLDPAADKMLVIAALLLLLDAERAAAAAVMLIVLREVVVSALREWAALTGIDAAVKVSSLGKWKTGMQMTAIPCLLAGDSVWRIFGIFVPVAAGHASPFVAAGEVFLWLSAALALWSMGQYCSAAWRAYKKSGA